MGTKYGRGWEGSGAPLLDILELDQYDSTCALTRELDLHHFRPAFIRTLSFKRCWSQGKIMESGE